MIAKNTLGVLIFLFVLINHSQAQNFEWGYGTGSTEFDQNYDITVNELGEVIQIGYFSETVNFNPIGTDLIQTSNGASDFFIEKRAADGSLIWLKTIGGPGSDVAQSVETDSEGNIVVCGVFSSTTDFDPGEDVFNMSAGAGTSLFILKLTTDGEFIWANSIAGEITGYHGDIMAINAADEIIITGGFEGTVDFDPSPEDANQTVGEEYSEIFIAKYNTNGEYLWANVIEGEGFKWVNEISLDHEGKIFLAGSYTNNIDLDPSDGTDLYTNPSDGGNGFLVKLSADGSYEWGKVLTSYVFSQYSALKFNDDYLVLSGTFSGTTDFDLGDETQNENSFGDVDAFIQKLDLNGELIWVNTYNSTTWQTAISGLVINSFNDIIVSGSFGEEMNFNHEGDSEIRTTPDVDAFVFQVSESGEFERIHIISGNFWQETAGLAISNADEIYVQGVLYEEVILADDEPTIPAVGWGDFFLMKLGEYASIDQSEIDVPFQMYPNPANQFITVEKSVNQTLEIIDLNGKAAIHIPAGSENETVDIHSLSKGIYFVQVSDKNAVKTKKLIVY